MPPAEHPPAPGHAISLRLMGTLIVSALGLSWLLVPRPGELIERLFKDKQYERVVSMLVEDAGNGRELDLGALRKLSPAQAMAISQLIHLTPREQLNMIFSDRRPPVYDLFVHNLVLAAIRYVDVIRPEEALQKIEPSLPAMEEPFRLDVLDLIAQNADGVGRTDVAAHALALACDCTTSSWPIARRMAQNFSWSNQPARAAARLRTWITAHHTGLKSAEREEAHKMWYAFALAGGDPQGALEACLAAFRDAPDGRPSTELMQRALDTATQCGQLNLVMPWLSKLVEALPESRMGLAELRKRAKEHPEQVEIARAWMSRIADIADWQSNFDGAFDARLRLAAMGDAPSLDRVIALADFVGGTQQCAELEELLGDESPRKDWRLLLAHDLSDLGRDEEARAHFEKWLADHPDDANARYDYCCLLDNMGEDKDLRPALEEMLRRNPGDAPAMRKLAELCIRTNDLETALLLYEKLPAKRHDADTLEAYHMIAEALDDHAAQVRALQLVAQRETVPKVSTYLELADAASYLSDVTPSVAALREGMERLPDSQVLRLALANVLIGAKRKTEAIAVLTDSHLRNNYEAVSALLGLVEDIADTVQVLAFLGPDVDRRLPLTERDRLQLAVLNARSGQVAESARLFATVPQDRAHLRMLAEAHYHCGHTDAAVRLMLAHLDTNPNASAADWRLLGDIYTGGGMPDQARIAYGRSLTLLTAELPGTASN